MLSANVETILLYAMQLGFAADGDASLRDPGVFTPKPDCVCRTPASTMRSQGSSGSTTGNDHSASLGWAVLALAGFAALWKAPHKTVAAVVSGPVTIAKSFLFIVLAVDAVLIAQPWLVGLSKRHAPGFHASLRWVARVAGIPNIFLQLTWRWGCAGSLPASPRFSQQARRAVRALSAPSLGCGNARAGGGRRRGRRSAWRERALRGRR